MSTNMQTRHEIVQALAAAGCGILRRRVPIPAATNGSRSAAIVREVLADQKGEPKLAALLTVVALRTGLSRAEIISPRRDKALVRARMIFYRLAKEFTAKSLPAIGRACGDRDHSTIIHGMRMVEEQPERFEPELSEILTALRERSE